MPSFTFRGVVTQVGISRYHETDPSRHRYVVSISDEVRAVRANAPSVSLQDVPLAMVNNLPVGTTVSVTLETA